MNTEEEVLKFMTKNMPFIGFGNYYIALKVVKHMEALAQIEPSIMGQRLLLTLPKSFFKLHEVEQYNHLIHELLHAREWVRQKKVDDYCEKIKDDEEEIFINDCTRFVESLER